MVLTYEDVKGEVVYFTTKAPHELFEVVGYEPEYDFLKLKSLATGKVISGIHPQQVKLWHLMGGEEV